MFETSPIAMSLCRADGLIVEANPALGRLLGYAPEELIGTNPWTSPTDETHGEGRHDAKTNSPGGRPIFSELPGKPEPATVETLCRRRDGSDFWGRLTITPMSETRACEDSTPPQQNAWPALLTVVLEDDRERRQMQERLRQAEKMEVIGRLASAVAHDFNNLLTGILLYSDLLLPELPPESPLRHYVEEVRLATEQGRALTRQMLAVARKGSSAPHPVVINDVVDGIANLLRRLVGEPIALLTALEPAAGAVRADEGQLRQVLLNLVLNARDALGKGRAPGGKIRVSTRRGCWKSRVGAETNILLAVEDNGCGMNAETLAHLFEPFFTTKKAGEGTGIGLGTVRRIVDEFGGTIAVSSAPGLGTRFEVFLPAADESPITEPVPTLAAGGRTLAQLSAIADAEATDSQMVDGVD
jgi:two-component system cell cycle sensor histidine kinase/response regulator CckA